MKITIAHCVEVNTWDDMKVKYPMYRDEMTEDQEKEFVNDCFKLYEKEGFAKVFWSQDGDYEDYYEKSFEIVRRCDTNDSDLTCLPMWMIKFEDGFEMAAYSDEVIPSEMADNGCKIKNLKRD